MKQVKLYPRLSIENSRRVRELSHHVQYELLKSTRKRMEKFIPKIVGSWLAGTYDRDRGVAKAANNGITSFLDTESRLSAFWKRCQLQILDFAQETFDETPETLSDTRTVTADDAQEKYFRVVGSSVSLVLNLLIKLKGEDISKYQSKYEDFLTNNSKLWALASSEDSAARRSIHQLLAVCLAKQPTTIESNIIEVSRTFIGGALSVKQTASAYQLVQALSVLTRKHPEVWTSAYNGKTPALTRLRHFVDMGSQGGPPEYWQSLQSLIFALPKPLLTSQLQNSLKFLEAIRNGISSREEPRANAQRAWPCYFEICASIADTHSDPKAPGRIFKEAVHPAFVHHLHPTPGSSKWLVGSTRTLAKAYSFWALTKDDETKSLLRDSWSQLGSELITALQISHPEQSKDYHKSQTAVLTQGHRWFEIYGQILKDSQEASHDYITAPSRIILTRSLEIMVSRDGKPYSAAAVIEVALREAPSFTEIPEVLEPIKEIFEHNFAILCKSPSAKYIISALFHIRSLTGQDIFFEQLWQNILIRLLTKPITTNEIQAIAALISDDKVSNLAQQSSRLQDFLLESFSKALQGDSSFWPLIEAALGFGSMTENTTNDILDKVLDCLDINKPFLAGGFKALDILSKKPELLKSHDIHIALVTKLLALVELSDSTVAPRAAALKAVIETSSQIPEQAGFRQPPIVHIIRENLDFVSPQSLSIDTLVEQAKLVLHTGKDSIDPASIFPNITLWSQGLKSLINTNPSPALAVVRPFAGAVYLVNEVADSPSKLPKDLNGHSSLLRMAMYTSSLVAEEVFKLLSRRDQLELVYLLCLTSELANDQVDSRKDSDLFEPSQGLDPFNEIRELISKTRTFLASFATDSRSWRRNKEDDVVDSSDSSALMHELIFKLITMSASTSGISYYSAKSLSLVLSKLVDAHGWQTDGGDEWLTKIDVLKTSTMNVLGAVGILTGLGEDLDTSKLVNTLCNRLISDVAGASSKSDKTLPMLVLLNSILPIYDDSDMPVAQNRLVFAVKQILSWTNDDLATKNPQLASEACRALHKLLPAIKSVFGSYWETSLSFCCSIWNSSLDGQLSEDSLPMVGMSLKLYLILVNLEDANDDLEESLDEFRDKLSRSLVKLLQLRRIVDSPLLEFVDGLLSRALPYIPSSSVFDQSELYHLVASDFPAVQSAAYELLSKALPEVQQQLSVDVLLENTNAQLPEELLSLLLDAPSTGKFSPEELEEFPATVRSYLLSWHLVYTSYSNSSYKVQTDYTETLKSENIMAPLLDFLFDALGHSTAQPLSLDRHRFDEDTIKSFNIWKATESESKERSMQWLLVNLYYSALRYTPSLVKSWYFDCKSKQTRIAVESWTEKYFAPIVSQEVLAEVSKWAEEQELESDDEKLLKVKIHKSTREIFASYEVDDTAAEIVIKLPSNFPLENIKVEGVCRAAANDRKWQGWLMNIQGAISFSVSFFHPHQFSSLANNITELIHN